MNKPFGQIRRAQVLVSAALVLAAALAGCSPQEDQSMSPSTTTPQTVIPGLDAAVPAHVDTATFALG